MLLKVFISESIGANSKIKTNGREYIKDCIEFLDIIPIRDIKITSLIITIKINMHNEGRYLKLTLASSNIQVLVNIVISTVGKFLPRRNSRGLIPESIKLSSVLFSFSSTI
jgi:hypothetical protein